MFDSITFHLNPYFGYSTLFFTSVSIPCEFVMLPDVYILLSPQEEEVHFLMNVLPNGNRCTNLAAHSSKRLNSLPVIILVCFGNT